ncbi:pilus assembly protein [Thioclava litoralis]|uniref:Pilus assembly protein n=1 Tax=Thioclava litoralis TaxID=3076557 RepID=A0ABZ1E2Y8_9RHOB|nr:pilus assembly protein [Thioclava sp. FTW29]
MKLFRLTKKFRNEEDGAVTVDWVVLTAAIVGLGVAVVTIVGKNIYKAGSDISVSPTAPDFTTSSTGG